MLSAVRDLYGDGNAYALALRNDRFEIDELHLMRASLCRPMVAETGDVFYNLAGNAVIAQMFGGQQSRRSGTRRPAHPAHALGDAQPLSPGRRIARWSRRRSTWRPAAPSHNKL